MCGHVLPPIDFRSGNSVRRELAEEKWPLEGAYGVLWRTNAASALPAGGISELGDENSMLPLSHSGVRGSNRKDEGEKIPERTGHRRRNGAVNRVCGLGVVRMAAKSVCILCC